MLRLIVSDLDGTLLNSQKRLSPYTAEVLSGCRSRGVRVAVATARPERAARTVLGAFQPDAVISDNGAVVTCVGEPVYKNLIPGDLLRRVLGELLLCGAVTCITAEAGDCLLTNYRGAVWEEGWNLVHTDFSVIPAGTEITKLSTECRDLREIQEILSSYPELHLFSNTGEPWQQIQLWDSTKSNGIRRLSERLRIPLSQTIAFGDDVNDIDMLRCCGVGVAMRNAIDAVKAAADEICGDNDGDGVAEWLAGAMSRME